MLPPSPEFVTLPRGLRVRLALGSDAVTLDAVVRAVEEDRLVLGVPRLPAAATVRAGAEVEIAAQLHGRAYEMRASVLAVEQAPPAIVVSLPSEARRTQRRTFYRLNVSIEAHATWQDCDAAGGPAGPVHALAGVRLLDLSGGGTLLRVRGAVPLGARLHVRFPLEPGAPDIEVTGRAQSSQPEPGGHAYRVNTEFEGIARRTEERIVRFIFLQQSLLSRRRSA